MNRRQFLLALGVIASRPKVRTIRDLQPRSRQITVVKRADGKWETIDHTRPLLWDDFVVSRGLNLMIEDIKYRREV